MELFLSKSGCYFNTRVLEQARWLNWWKSKYLFAIIVVLKSSIGMSCVTCDTFVLNSPIEIGGKVNTCSQLL
jgi:hypothetical protein